MKVHPIKFPIILLILSLITVIGLSNCGQTKTANNTDSNIDTATQEADIPAVTTDTIANIEKTDNTSQEVKVDAKNEPKAVSKSPAKQIVINNKKPVTNTKVTAPENKPVTQPKPAPVVKATEPVKEAPVAQPKPAEVSKPAPVATPKPVQGGWVVPAKYKSMTSPYPNNKESITLGKSLYSTHCKSCHGSSGAGDGSKASTLDTEIRSFRSEGFKAQTPGEVYYKSIFGRGDMPRFGKKIPDDEEQWALVHYIMSL